jgi:hypothetical protein
MDEHFWMLATQFQPVIAMSLELRRMQASPSWMLRIVVVDLRVALKAKRDRVRYVAAGVRRGTFNVVDFHLDATEPVTDAAATMAGDEQGLDFLGSKLMSRHAKSSGSSGDRPPNVAE